MAIDVSKYTNEVRTAVMAKDVRGSIADSIDNVASEVNNYETTLSADNDQFKDDIGTRQTNIETRETNLENTFDAEIKNAASSNPSSAETVAARQGYDTLLKNLEQKDNKIGNLTSLNTTTKDSLVNAVNEVNSQLAENTQQINTTNSNVSTLTTNLTTTNNNVSSLQNTKADTSYVDNKVASVASGAPDKTFATLTDLNTAYPTGDSKNKLVSANGHIYNWNGSAWADTGIQYLSAGIALGEVTPSKISTSGNKFADIIFEDGSIDGATGANQTSTTRVRMQQAKLFKTGEIISVASGYKFNYYRYSDENMTSFISTGGGWNTTDYTVPSDRYLRFNFAKTDDSTISVANVTPSLYLNCTEYLMINPENLSDRTLDLIKGDNTNTIDLFMFMGQSNMAGRGITNGTWTEVAPTIISGAGYEFRAISDPTKLYNMTEPFGINENDSLINDGTMKTGSMVTAFTNAYYKATNIPIVGVSASQGGQSITTFQNNNDHLTGAINRFNAAITWLTNNGYTIRHKYMVWCQGETDGDGGMSGTDYKTYFETMLNAMINAGIEKCFLVRIGNYNGAGSQTYTNIIDIQTQIAQTNKNVIMVTTDLAGMKAKGLMKDDFHYYQAGYNEFGTYAGVNTAKYVLTGKEPTMYDTEDGTLYFSHKN